VHQFKTNNWNISTLTGPTINAGDFKTSIFWSYDGKYLFVGKNDAREEILLNGPDSNTGGVKNIIKYKTNIPFNLGTAVLSEDLYEPGSELKNWGTSVDKTANYESNELFSFTFDNDGYKIYTWVATGVSPSNQSEISDRVSGDRFKIYKNELENNYSIENIKNNSFRIDEYDNITISSTLNRADLKFSKDGRYFYIPERRVSFSNEPTWAQFEMSNYWDISTSTKVRDYEFENIPNVRSIYWKPDGKKLWALSVTATVFEFTATVPWRIDTLSDSDTFTASEINQLSPTTLWWSPNGQRLFIKVSESFLPSLIYQYDVENAWDMSTLTFTKTLDVSSPLYRDEINQTRETNMGMIMSNGFVLHTVDYGDFSLSSRSSSEPIYSARIYQFDDDDLAWN